MDLAEQPVSRRERLRERTRQEIKDGALRQITQAGGAGELSLNALAKSLGMAGPSLYRYYASRDALLTELVVDGFTALAEAVEAPVVDSAAEQLRLTAAAYRAWALANPQVYELILGTPVPGYAAPMEVTGPVAARGMQHLVRLVERVHREARTRSPASRVPPHERWQGILDAEGGSREAFAEAVGLWARMHGLVSLELRGHLPEMVADPTALYDGEIERSITALLP